MATRKKASARFERVVEEVQEAAGKASVKVEHAVDKLKDEAKDVERAVRHSGDGLAAELEERTGIPASKSKIVIRGLILLAIGLALFGIAHLLT